jgi:transcription initiation factor TFIID subunit 1
MSGQEETDVISALTGFSINNVLDGLSLPVGGGLSNQLGISGVPTLNSAQIYNDKWDEDDAVGPDQGEDWEDEIDREMREEGDSEGFVKHEAHSPGGIQARQKRIRVVKRLVERPKSVYERFPAFEKDKTLDFSELFKGYTVNKSRLAKRPYQSKPQILYHEHFILNLITSRNYLSA